MRPSQALSQHRDAICLAVARYRVANPRVFGSALRGDDRDGSDLDHMRQAIADAQSFTQRMAQADFEQDKRTQ